MASDTSIENELRTATAEYRAGNLASAEARIDKLLGSNPNRADVHLAKGILLIGKGDQAGGLESLQSALHFDPSNMEALGWAAFTCLNLRRFDDAERLARKLTVLDPKNVRGHYLLANALRALDRTMEGVQAIDRALELQPNDTDNLVTKARLLKQWRMPSLAVEFYRMALSIRPTPSAAVDLAKILLQESHPEEALSVLQSVSQTMSIEQKPHALIAQAYTEMRRFAEADQAWRMAERYGHDRGAVLQAQATAQISAGRFEVAEELLLNAIEQENAPDAFFTILSTARKMTAGDMPLIKRMEAIAGKGQIAGVQLAHLNYALGKSFDDLKEFEKAIGYFDEANRICLQIYPRRKNFNRESAKAFTDFQIEYFTADRIAELSEFGVTSELPMFVVGMMRSGTTLTESILSAHSQVKGGGEQSFWTERAIELFHPGSDGLEFDHTLATRFSDDYLKLVEPKEGGYRYVVDKNPGNIDLASMLNCIYPNAKLVHVKRHPVDNLLSIWMTPVSGNVGYASDRSNLVFTYREYQRLCRHLNDVLPSDRFSTFRYEDLTSNPDETIRAMLQFADLEPEPDCFAPERNERTVLTPSVHQVRQPIHKGAQERWKNYEPWLGDFAELLADLD